MDKTVELITEWAAFAAKDALATLEDFYRYKLIQSSQEPESGVLVGGVAPPETNLLLIKLLDRIVRLYTEYAGVAISDTGIQRFDEFLFLNAIANLNEPRKTDVIAHMITGLSSGLLVIDRLKKYGYVAEKDDADDRRARRLYLTSEGETVLQRCYEQTSKLGAFFFEGLTEDDMRLCIQLLKGVEIRFSALWPQHRGKSFETFVVGTP